MVKLKGPSVSTDASGKLANALIFSASKKRHYAKAHATPKNPRSLTQVGRRAMMRFLATEWRALTPADHATWTALADQMRVYPYHAFVSLNQQRWTNFVGPTKQDPAAPDSLPHWNRDMNVTGGVRMITYQIDTKVTWPKWGAIVFRHTATPFTASITTAKIVTHLLPGQFTTVVETNVEPGFYHLRNGVFGPRGYLQIAVWYNTVTVTA